KQQFQSISFQSVSSRLVFCLTEPPRSTISIDSSKMFAKPFTSFSLILSALALPTASIPDTGTGLPKPPTLPACDETPRSCACPPGTFFQESTSYAFYSASAADITRITGNCKSRYSVIKKELHGRYFSYANKRCVVHETAWFGTSSTNVTGSPYNPGAKRFLMGEIPDAG